MSRNRRIIHNGRMIPEEAPALPAGARTVRYGDGCFETLRSYAGAFLHLDDHLQRLHGGLEYLDIPLPDGLRQPALNRQIGDLLEENGLGERDAIIRLQVWREGGRGYTVRGDEPAGYAISTDPLAEIAPSVTLATVAVRRIPAAALDPQWKLSGGTNHIVAARQAREQEADDALMLTVDGRISETTVANLFWVRDHTVYTPSAACDLLPGITRSILIGLVGEMGSLQLREGRYKPEEMTEAEAVWTCNSLREVQPVSSIDGNEFDTDHPAVGDLQERFRRYIERNAEMIC